VITTVAGNGTAGFSGDNGPATGASLNFPWAVAVDAQDHLYISDLSNNRIRRVDLSTHVITTVAGNGNGTFGGDGGQATSASIAALRASQWTAAATYLLPIDGTVVFERSTCPPASLSLSQAMETRATVVTTAWRPPHRFPRGVSRLIPAATYSLPIRTTTGYAR